MTEDEARTKWCPMVRYKSGGGEGINRWATSDDKNYSPDHSKCIASDCMMWREIREQDSSTGYWNIIGGYCGLGGKP